MGRAESQSCCCLCGMRANGARFGTCQVQSIRWAAIRSFARKWVDRELSPPVITFWFRSDGANRPFPTRLPFLFLFSQNCHDRAVFCVTEGGGSSEVRNGSTPTAGSKWEVFELTISAEPRGRVSVSFFECTSCGLAESGLYKDNVR